MAGYIKGVNDLETWCIQNNRTDIIELWDTEKNLFVKPSDVHFGSSKKVWWKCLKGHPSYEMSIEKKVKREQGCPYCSGKRVTLDNCIATLFPHLLGEWDYEKNGNNTPYDFTKGSEFIAWWKCSKGHSYDMSIHRKIRTKKCPICCGQRISKDNCLATKNPKLAKEWHPFKNDHLTPYDVLPGSHKIVWWKCKKNHEWKTPVYSRGIMGCGCPICDSEKRTSFPEQIMFYYLKKVTSATSRNKIEKFEADIFLPNLNYVIEYDGEYYHSMSGSSKREYSKNIFFKNKGIRLIRVKERKRLSKVIDVQETSFGLNILCRYSQDYIFMESVIEAIISDINKVHNCKLEIDVNIVRDRSEILSSYVEVEKANSLANKKPLAAKKWDYSKNKGVSPSIIPFSSKKRFFFVCQYCGYEWESAVENVSNTEFCPKCIHSNHSNEHKGTGYSLIDIYPNLLEEWDFESNENLNPYDLTPGSNKKVWWICKKCNHRYLTTVKSKVKGHGCLKCAIQEVAQSKHKKVLNIDTGEIFESIKSASIKYNCNRICISNCCNGKSKSAGGYHWKFVE